MKFFSFYTAAACLLAGCAQTPSVDGQHQLTRAERETTTGSMLPRHRADSDSTMVINKDQIDTTQILQAPTTLHVKTN